MIKFTKIIAIKNIKDRKQTLLNLMIFIQKKHVSKKYDIQKSSKGKYFNSGKPYHHSKDCEQKPSNLKNKFNMLKINDNDKKELFKILEHTALFDSLEEDFSSSSNSDYQSANESFGSPNFKIGCRDSCCNTIKTVNVLTKREENESLLITLISQIENPELKKEYLNKLHKNLTRDENVKKTKLKISLEETLERFNKKKSKELTINDLQQETIYIKEEIIQLKNEFKIIKADNLNLKQEMLLLRIDKKLDNHFDNENDERRDRDESSQQAPLSSNDAFTNSQLNLINKMLPPK